MKKICPPTKGVAIRNYLLREHLSSSCIIDKRDSWTDYLALWIWFTSTVAVCIPATSIDALPRISSNPVHGTRCPFAINNSFSMWSAPNKEKYFGNPNSEYSHYIILPEAYIG